MADKEATVYIVDVGASMGRNSSGREETNLDYAMRYVWDKITSTVALDRKTATVGVIGLRTDGTANELLAEESFQNISVFQQIGQILLPDLTRLRRRIELSNTNKGDAISSIVIAIQMVAKYCKKLKYKRKIVLVTDGCGSLDADESSVSEITKKLIQDQMELVIIGVDFDDPDYGFGEEDKNAQKAWNEKVFKNLAEESNGIFGTLKQAVDELGIPRLKSTRAFPSYKGKLTLGNPQQYESAAVIDVERYPRTMIRKPPTASQFVQRSEFATGSTQSTGTLVPDGDVNTADSNSNRFTNIKTARAYHVQDKNAPGGKRDVDRDDLAKGYEYGRTAVHITESDKNITTFETEAGLDIVGFVPWSNFDRYMSMSVSSMIKAQKTNSKAVMALSSLIHALFELESYAIARLVPKINKGPTIILLAPSIEVDYECLLDVQIPFAEDVRSYKFPPLDRVVTVSGKMIKEHRNLPSDPLQSAMDIFVDTMDLANFGKDEDGNPTEYMPMSDTYSPVLHRIDQAVRWRAVRPTEPIPPPSEILTRYSRPPEELLSKSKHCLEKLTVAANVKKVPPKVRGRKRDRNEIKPLSGLDVESLLAGGAKKKKKVSQQNPIPNFKQMLDAADSIEGIHDAVNQLGSVVEGQIKDSFGDIAYGRAIEEIGVMKEEMIELEMPDIYNYFVTQLKRKLLAEQLGGNRKDMWWEMRKSKMGLIDRKMSKRSKVTEDEAKKFWSIECPQ